MIRLSPLGKLELKLWTEKGQVNLNIIMGSISMSWKQLLYHVAEFLTLLYIFFVFVLLMVIGNI